ncbi:MAG TPA: MFS transporter [Jatrophihabitans sp.]|nr:MFS transporter [Jatrophihabitans sp.]
MTAPSGIRRLLPPSRHERAYALITAVDSLGTGSFLTASVVLFVRLVGVTPTQVGTGLAVGGVVSLFARVPLGRLSDRFGHRRSLIAVHLIRGLVFPLYLVIHGFLAFVLLSVFVLVVDGWESPVRKVVLYAFAPVTDRVRIAAYNRSVYNLAFAAGSLLAACALATGDSRIGLYLVVAGNAASFLLAAGFAARLPAELVLPAPPGDAGGSAGGREFAAVGLLLGTLFLCTSMLTIGIPLLVLRHFAGRPWLIGLALAVNTAVAVALQVPLARGCEDLAGATRSAVRAGLLLAGGCLLCCVTGLLGGSVLVLLAAVIVLSLGELTGSAAVWGLGLFLRRHDVTAHNQSLWSMYNSLPQLLGPFVVAWSLHTLADYGWLAMAAVVLLAAFALRPIALAAGGRLDEPAAAPA